MSRPALPAGRVSRNPPLVAETKPVRVARITDAEGVIVCSCGWAKPHRRRKVREDRAQDHLNKKHGGMGMWF